MENTDFEFSGTSNPATEEERKEQRGRLSEILYEDLLRGIHPLNNKNLYDYLMKLPENERGLLFSRYTPMPRGINPNVEVCFFTRVLRYAIVNF